MKTAPRIAVRKIAAAGIFALVLGACAAPADPPMPTPKESNMPPTSSSASTVLTITIRQSADAEPEKYRLECDGDSPDPASTLPNAAEACAVVARLGVDFFTALPEKDRACTQQYGGPQTAVIAGRIEGTEVKARFALSDGCEIARWQEVLPLLGPGGVS